MTQTAPIEVATGKWTGGQRPDRRQFLQDNLLATVSTLAAGLLGFLLQGLASHDLHPAQYGKVFAVMGFFTLVTRPSAAFGRLQAWHTSRELSTDGIGDKSGVLLRDQTIKLMTIGSLAALVCIIFGKAIGTFLHVPMSNIVVGAISIPFLLAVQPLLGSLQGEQRFILWSLLSILVNLSRLVLIVALISPMASFGALAGNTLASIATFSACLAAVWRNITVPRSPDRHFLWRPVLPLVITGLAATLALGVFQGADVILVEHFFPKVPAGQYAAVAAVASAVFFASGGVASAVFPMVAARHAQGRSTVSVMAAAFALCALAGLIGTVLMQVFGRVVLLDFAGKKYVPGAHYLGWYSLSMAVLAWVVVLVNTQQSLNKLSLLWVLVPAIILRPVLIILFHQTLMTVVVVSDLTVSCFALVLTAMYMASERARVRAWSAAPRHRIRTSAAGA